MAFAVAVLRRANEVRRQARGVSARQRAGRSDPRVVCDAPATTSGNDQGDDQQEKYREGAVAKTPKTKTEGRVPLHRPVSNVRRHLECSSPVRADAESVALTFCMGTRSRQIWVTSPVGMNNGPIPSDSDGECSAASALHCAVLQMQLTKATRASCRRPLEHFTQTLRTIITEPERSRLTLGDTSSESSTPSTRPHSR